MDTIKVTEHPPIAKSVIAQADIPFTYRGLIFRLGYVNHSNGEESISVIIMPRDNGRADVEGGYQEIMHAFQRACAKALEFCNQELRENGLDELRLSQGK